MDTIETQKTNEIGLGKDLVKTFAKTTAESAGVWAGLGVVLVAAGQIIRIKNDRFNKKHRIESN